MYAPCNVRVIFHVDPCNVLRWIRLLASAKPAEVGTLYRCKAVLAQLGSAQRLAFHAVCDVTEKEEVGPWPPSARSECRRPVPRAARPALVRTPAPPILCLRPKPNCLSLRPKPLQRGVARLCTRLVAAPPRSPQSAVRSSSSARVSTVTSVTPVPQSAVRSSSSARISPVTPVTPVPQSAVRSSSSARISTARGSRAVSPAAFAPSVTPSARNSQRWQRWQRRLPPHPPPLLAPRCCRGCSSTPPTSSTR